MTAPPSGSDFSQFKPDLEYQVVVSNLDSPEWPSQLMTSFEEYMKDGRGTGGGACRRQRILRSGRRTT